MSEESGGDQALQKQAPGVRGARSAPRGESTLRTGDVVGGKFIVARYLGASSGTVNYFCKDQKRDRDTVIKVIDESIMTDALRAVLEEQIPIAARVRHAKLTAFHGMGRVDQGHLFVATEYVSGTTLARAIAQWREQGRAPNLRDVFSAIAHICDGLEAARAVGLSHGALTPYNVHVARDGSIKVSSLVLGRITATALKAHGQGPYVDSAYIAPEVAADPARSSSAADVFSAAMIAIEMLSPAGLPAGRDAARIAAVSALDGRPGPIASLLINSIEAEPDPRVQTPGELRDRLERACRDAGVKISRKPRADDMPIAAAVEPSGYSDIEEDLFALPASGHRGLFEASEASEAGRYLVQKGGLDYGPFTKDQVLEQLHADEIHEATQVLDRQTQERVPLQDAPAFEDEVRAYIPVREARLRREAEARAALQRKVKKGGIAVFVAGIIAGLCVLAVMVYFVLTRPEPEPIPFERAFAELDFKLLPPPKEFKTVAVDAKVLQSIFDPRASEAEVQKQLKRLRRRSRKVKAARRRGGEVEESVNEIDMSAGGAASGKILSDQEVNDVILGKFGSMRRCVVKELARNPGFSGVTVQFFIRPSGTTGGVKVRESKYAGSEVGSCLVSRFRSLKFPEHGGFNKGVVFPLRVQ